MKTNMKNATQTEQINPQDEIEALLPWYANGTLDAADAARVEAALAKDNELARHLTLVRDEMGEAILDNQNSGSPSSHVLDKLMRKIDAEPSRSKPLVSGVLDLGGYIASWFQPKTLAWATVAGAAIIALQAGFLGDMASRQGAGFQTASSPDAPGAMSGSFLLVGFAPEATSIQISDILARAKATIVDGPKPGGIYKLRIGQANMDKAELEKIVVLLRSEVKIIRFVGVSPQ